MPKEYITLNVVIGAKNPLGVKVVLDTASLVTLGLISDTNILFPEEDQSTQKRRLLIISIYHLNSKF
jgi:hypothetical protein